MKNDPELPIACDLSSLDGGQRLRRAHLATTIRDNMTRVVETENGYQLHLRSDAEVVRHAEELIALERKCCRFLTIDLRRDEIEGDWVLEVNGADGTKAFIVAEMGILGAQRNAAG